MRSQSVAVPTAIAIALAIVLLWLLGSFVTGDAQESAGESAMTTARLEALLRSSSDEVERDGAAWRFEYGGVEMICVADAGADRMRIMAPVVLARELDENVKDRLLVANYHSALDARYAIGEGVLYSTFIHPLSPLTDAQVVDALRQVATLKLTFGTSYRSSDLILPGQGGQQPQQESEKELET